MKNENIVAVEEWKGKLLVVKFKVITNEHQANVAMCNFLAQTNGSSKFGSGEKNSKIRKHYF